MQIYAPNDAANDGQKEQYWEGQVNANDTHLNLGKGPWTGDPLPGGHFIWAVNACSNSSTTSSAILVTDTLPAHMTLLEWWGQHPGWSQVSWDSTQLVVTRPALPNGWCSQVYLRFQVDSDVLPGTYIGNTAAIWAANDMETNDNQTSSGVTIGSPRDNLSINMWWGGGSLVPGGEFRFHMNFTNNGNRPVSGIWLTDTLPASTSLVHIRRYDNEWRYLGDATPIWVDGDTLTWEVGAVDNGESGHFEIAVRADGGAVPGTDLVNTLEITRLPDEDAYTDNTAVWSDMLFNHGPNLRISKRSWWSSDNRLSYQIDFHNVGDQMVSNAWITDVLPANTTTDGWFNMGYEWNRLIAQDHTSTQMRWQFSEIYPGDNGWLQLNANLDDPNIRPRIGTPTPPISACSPTMPTRQTTMPKSRTSWARSSAWECG